MKKIAIFLFAIAASIVLNGTANADTGFWYHNSGGSWATYFNLRNTDTTNIVTATVTFNDMTNTLVGSTTRTMAAGSMWNFSTDAAGPAATGTVTTTQLGTSVRGIVLITGSSAGKIRGYSTIMNATASAGFNFRMPGSETSTAD